MNKKIIIGIAAAAILALGYGALRKNPPAVEVEESTPASTPEVSVSPTPLPTPTPQDNESPRVREIRLPSMSIEEFTSPNFVSASPAHKEAAALGDLKAITLKFSAPLEARSRITVLVGNKVAASGGEISNDGKTLSVAFAAGAFAPRNLSSGIYGVYYDACFAHDTCYKGQYGFYGIAQ